MAKNNSLYAQRVQERTYGTKWELDSEETLTAEQKKDIKKIVFEYSPEYNTPQLVFYHLNGSWTPFKADRDCRDVLDEGDVIDVNSVKIRSLVNPMTGETTTQAYGEVADDDEADEPKASKKDRKR